MADYPEKLFMKSKRGTVRFLLKHRLLPSDLVLTNNEEGLSVFQGQCQPLPLNACASDKGSYLDYWSPIAFSVRMGLREGTSAHEKTQGPEFQCPNPSRKVASLVKSTSVLEEDWVWFPASSWKLTIPFSSSLGNPTPSSDICGILHAGDAPHTYTQIYTNTHAHAHMQAHTHMHTQ